MASKLAEAATASIQWAGANGVAFDHGKTEAAIFWKKRKASKAVVRVGDNDVPFNKQATRWLGVWLDSHLKLRAHQAVRMKEGRKAMTRLRRLTGQMGLSPASCRKVMSACVQSTAMFGAELWWKGKDGGTAGLADELQVLVNQEARATTGCFRTTNQGALAMEAGLRPAVAQLDNRQRHFALRLLSLPEGERAKKIVGSDTAIGKRLAAALNYTWTATEEVALPEVMEQFDAALVEEEREEAKKEAETERPGFVMFTDGSRLENGATGYAVTWKNGQSWEGIKTHMGYNQEAFDAECAALARALETAAKSDPPPDHVTIFTDAQAAIRRMATDEPGPGQKYALEAREHIAALQRKAPSSIIEVRWCPAHEGVEGNEKADEWAKLAADEPDTPGVEWLDGARSLPLPRSLANIRREISEKKWVEARQWAGGRTSKKKYRLPKSQRPDSIVARSTKRLASQFYQLRTGHCLTGQYLNWTKRHPTPQCWWCPARMQTRDHLFKECPKWKPQQKILWAEVKKEIGRWKDRWKVRDLLADGRCSRAVLDFLSTSDVGRRAPEVEEDDAVSAVSELELREWLAEQEAGAEESGAGGTPPFLPTPDSMAAAETE